MYDSKPAEEYDSILRAIINILKFPDQIYRNLPGKRGDYCLVKNIEGKKYICSIELKSESAYLVTAFRIREGKEGYLDKYKLLWSWKGDNPSS